jgi:hypothetical protein
MISSTVGDQLISGFTFDYYANDKNKDRLCKEAVLYLSLS